MEIGPSFLLVRDQDTMQQRYYLTNVALVALCVITLSVPATLDFIAQRLPGTVANIPSMEIGPLKARASLAVVAFFAAILSGLYLLTLRGGFKTSNLLACLSALAIIATQPTWFYRSNLIEAKLRSTELVAAATPREVQVPVEVIREVTVEVPVEIIKEVAVEVVKEVTVEVPVEVIKEVEVPVEVRVPFETIKEVPVNISVPTPVYPNLRTLEIRELDVTTPGVQAAYQRGRFPSYALNDFESFHRYVSALWMEAEGEARSWDIESRTVRRIAFYAMVVGTLFEYGNKDAPELLGCSYHNEVLGGPVTYRQSQRQFLNSKIGCCNDYAYLMMILMDFEGIQNQMLVGAGHIWNEFVVDGQKYNVDANTGYVMASAWADLKRDGDLLIWKFPLAGAMPSAGERYRPILGVFSLYTMSRIVDGGFPVEYWDDIPQQWPLEDGIPPA